MQLRANLLHLMAVIAMATAQNNCKSIATFNVGLVGSVPNAESRRPRIIDALRNSTADVICLQEAWFERDMKEILNGVRDVFPHHYSKIHAARDKLRRTQHCSSDLFRIKDTACSRQDAALLLNGLAECGCLDLQGPIHQACFFFTCAHVLRNPSINAGCIACVVFEWTRFRSVTEDALIECVTPGDVDNRFNPPGLLIISKERIRRATYTPIFPDNKLIFERGFIQATLRDGKKIACTHLSANFSVYFEYNLTFTSFVEQSRAEMEILGRAIADQKPILAGDLNVSPREIGKADPDKNLAGDMTENYEFLTNTFGYDASPYFDQDGRCTFCNSNPLVIKPNNVIDFVMTVNGSSFFVSSIKRAFDSDVTPVPLSDHFGVQATVCEN